ncbi:phytanoyl-CoA dioxygenase family protein [Actinomycetospora sp. NBC_00405]|uniref:phytanoyl-CoA dioxygenase family protein n=1 Tax=Actinomycetospora sp. NBC_00405 TaxID=2975952 RepID=UPI002E1CB037
MAGLAEPYVVPSTAVASFAADGFVRLPGVVSPGAAEVLRRRLIALLDSGGSGSGLRSREMMWREDPLVRAGISAAARRHLGRAARRRRPAPLPRQRARKEPGAGRTPRHHDAHHFPLASHDVISTWMPLQAVPAAMGPLAFARGMDAWRRVDDLAFDKYGTSYDRRVAETFSAAGVEVCDEPFALGDVSFHSTLCFHTAGANRSTRSRMVLGATYYADGARIVDHPTMVSGDWGLFVPDTAPGEPATSAHNPLLELAGR